MRENEESIVLNPIILGELEFGILRMPAGRRRRHLHSWFLNRVVCLAVLNFDAGTASCWAHLLARLKEKATPMPIKDSLIAATALQHGLTVCTRNTLDFANAGVPIVNPFEADLS